ncbi:hypothetical protein G7046_g9050 [Stylonectria norvegica]|nr:hypothetical protein G7046_g9050 [Stylonectria norvegica]
MTDRFFNHPSAEFCLLEQLLPSGPHHPFAKTMLGHFDKLNTSLKSVHQYPTLENQRARFQSRGWSHVAIWDLWEVWSSDDFLSPSERVALDAVEPFDEWEEFILFARHYFVMHAVATANAQSPPKDQEKERHVEPSVNLDITRQGSINAPKRRFGAAMVASNPEGLRYAVHALGIGTHGRIGSCDVFSLGGLDQQLSMSPTGPSPRVCYTLTDLGAHGVLLTGGRASPTSAFADCWVFKRDSNSWRKTADLPTPLFRHSAIRLKGSSLALVLGGKDGLAGVSPDFFVFHPTKGWLKCETSGAAPEPVFAAVAINSSSPSSSPGQFRGLLSGGMLQDGTISTKAYRWELSVVGFQPLLRFEILERPSPLLSVVGAQVVEVGSATAICGGVGHDTSIQGQGISLVAFSDQLFKVVGSAPSKESSEQRPLMIGSSVVSLDTSLLIVGGGATCFSMGTFWETGVYTAEIPHNFSETSALKSVPRPLKIDYVESPQIIHSSSDELDLSRLASKAAVTTIDRIKLSSEIGFQELLRNRKPVVIEGLTLGECVDKWTTSYMVDRVGEEKEVVVHECQLDTEKLDFNSKNFRYVTESFKSFMDKAQAGKRLYLRSLSEEKPSESPANVDEDFPSLTADFVIPKELEYVKEHLFSSVLRISGRVNMWLHYDVMANVYTQIRGSKRMVLFPPTDVSHLAFAPGASSSSLDVFSALDTPLMAATHPYEAMLNPGDVLFLPPMWFHTAKPTTDMSIAINFFFPDLAAYEKGRQDVARIGKSFDRLPPEIRKFYLGRLADELLHDEQG